MIRSIIVGAFALGMFQSSTWAQSEPASRSSTLADFSESIQQLARTASPAVVQITIKSRGLLENSAGQHAGFIAEQQATGSGIIVDPDGYIVTNAHVVNDATRIDVALMDGGRDALDHLRHLAAKVIGIDTETDLAVLKVEATNLPTLQFLDSDTLQQGQLVVALGSPLGLENSFTVGFVSAPVRHLGTGKGISYVQTDTPINPGNSGGPLLDVQGRIAGINTMIMSVSGGSEGVGFAIPSNLVLIVYRGLRKNGHIRRGDIGVVAQDITPILARALALQSQSGVILSDVLPHGSAEAAGLEPGDIVFAADGKPVRKARELRAAVFKHILGEEIVIGVQRGRDRMDKTVGVLELSKSIEDLAEIASRDAQLVRRLGVLALTLNDKVTPILPDLRRLSGVVVAGIPAEFVGLNPGLSPGDVIYAINATTIGTLEELRTALDREPTGAAIALHLEREGKLLFLAFELE